MISKYGRHVINRRPLHILKNKKKSTKKNQTELISHCVAFWAKLLTITEFSCQFCILNTSNSFGFQFEVSLKCGQSCGGDSLENEAVESWSFRVRFSGRGTLYVQIPGKWHICDESRFPPGYLNLLCVVKIVFG